jgi:hypothetical protein
MKRVNQNLSLFLVFLGMSFLMGGCLPSDQNRLRKRAEGYYKALLYNDYETLYALHSGQIKKEVSAEQFVKFMQDLDTEADFEEFLIDSVVIRGKVGKVRLSFTNITWLFEGKKNVTSTWVKESGRWYVQKDPKGRFWGRYAGWLSKQRLEQMPKVNIQFKKIAERLEDYRKQFGYYPPRLDLLGHVETLKDPFTPDRLLRYHSDGKKFWIVAADGPDKEPDIEVLRFKGGASDYPPVDLVYDPATGQGDLFVHGPEKSRRRYSIFDDDY